MENTLKCIRTLAYNEFTDSVKKILGRPLTQKESFLASQMVYDIATDPQCLYCYVSLDRKAYDEFLLRYINQRDSVLEAFRGMTEEQRAIGDKAPHAALPELYKQFLDGRKDTKEQQYRFDMWIRNEIDGIKQITASDLSTSDMRKTILNGLDTSLARQIRDAEKYAQSASWAKKDVDYISYIGELLKLSLNWIKKLTGEYGLRFYSFSEYTPAFLLENMQMVRDAALRGLNGLAYTKEVDFVKVFAPTGMNINCSCYGRMDNNGNMQMDTLQGADWEEVKALREKYPNVGSVFVATNDVAVEWALAQDWIDVVIPFHIVRTGKDIADFYGWTNYSKEQADNVIGSSRSMYISPVEHKNDKATFLEACERHGVTPRFSQWIDNPNYMKLVNETRLSVEETTKLQPIFDMNAAKDSWDRFVNIGGYYNGWWNVDAEGYANAVRRVVEDIRSGKMASEVDYGRQNIPVNIEKMVAAARKKKIHGNVPLVDVYDRSGNALTEKKASLRLNQPAKNSVNPSIEGDKNDLKDEILTRAGSETETISEKELEKSPQKPIYTEAQKEGFAKQEKRRIGNAAREMAARLGIEDDVEFIETNEGLTGRKATAKGWFSRKTGKIVIVLGNHISQTDVLRTIIHEGVAHYGLRKLLGERFDTFLDEVFKNAEQEVKESILELSKKHGYNIRTATEEYLASLAEKMDFEKAKNSGWWTKIKSMFLDMMRQLGLGTYAGPAIKDNELRYLLWRSYENLAEPGRMQNPFAEAKDTSKQLELKVGGYENRSGRVNTTSDREGDLLFRDGDFTERDEAIARDAYENAMRSGRVQFIEEVQDSMRSLVELYKAILGKETRVEDIEGFENPYMFENRLSSMNMAQQHLYFMFVSAKQSNDRLRFNQQNDSEIQYATNVLVR